MLPIVVVAVYLQKTVSFRWIVQSNGLNRLLFKPQSNRSGLYVNIVTLRSNRSLTAAWTAAWPATWTATWPGSLYINYGDVMQTAVVKTAAVCLGHKNEKEVKLLKTAIQPFTK